MQRKNETARVESILEGSRKEVKIWEEKKRKREKGKKQEKGEKRVKKAKMPEEAALKSIQKTLDVPSRRFNGLSERKSFLIGSYAVSFYVMSFQKEKKRKNKNQNIQNHTRSYIFDDISLFDTNDNHEESHKKKNCSTLNIWL